MAKTKSRILAVDMNQKATEDFLIYANAVIKSRAIPRVEDNLKPVHRRILFDMGNELDLYSNKKHKKSAKVVGSVMGSFHPHGDSSIYNAMVRLGQPWKMRYPLVEIQGNAGNILGDGPAASRYTEARLTPFGDLMLEGIKKKGVPFKPNYDETTMEPVVLPSIFPNILCNGNAGIAVGFSSSLVPHNLREVVAGIVAYLDFKGISVAQLMKHIPGPDFPTGGTIVDSSKLAEIYETGQGTITLRSKYTIETVKSQTHIVIHEVPYLVDIESGIIDSIRKLVVEDNFDLIEEVENNTGQGGINLRIILKKGANLYKVLDTLWAKTRLQVTQRISNTVIVDGNPVVLSLKDLIVEYVKHRHNVIIDIAKFDLDKVESRMHIVEALLKALANIDPVIKLIKESDNKSDARNKLIAFLGITEIQANAILDMKLSRLSKLDGVELTAELENLQKQKELLMDIISNPAKREFQMRQELYGITNRYGDDRRTTLSNIGGEALEASEVEKLNILLMQNGTVFATQQDLKSLNTKKRGSPLTAAIRVAINTTTDKTLGVFCEDGTLVHLKPLMLSREQVESGLLPSAPVAAFELGDETLPPYTIFCSSDGLIKRTPTSEYINAKNKSRTTKLRDGQHVAFVGFAHETDYVAILDTKLNYFKVDSFPAQSKLTLGSKAISSGGIKSAAIASEDAQLLMMNEKGQGKLVNASELVVGVRGGVGQVVAENTTVISEKGEAYFIFDGKRNHLITSNPTVKSKTAVGAKIITGAPQKVAALK